MRSSSQETQLRNQTNNNKGSTSFKRCKESWPFLPEKFNAHSVKFSEEAKIEETKWRVRR